MGFWQTFKTGFNQGVQKARVEGEAKRFVELSKVIKVVEPNYGRIVTVEITRPEQYLKFYVSQLTTGAETLKCKVSVSGNKVTIEAPDSNIAEIIRKTWSQP